jgi:hypothetical protein
MTRSSQDSRLLLQPYVNSGLVKLIRLKGLLDERHLESLYGATGAGYTDYPTLTQVARGEAIHA